MVSIKRKNTMRFRMYGNYLCSTDVGDHLAPIFPSVQELKSNRGYRKRTVGLNENRPFSARLISFIYVAPSSVPKQAATMIRSSTLSQVKLTCCSIARHLLHVFQTWFFVWPSMASFYYNPISSMETDNCKKHGRLHYPFQPMNEKFPRHISLNNPVI